MSRGALTLAADLTLIAHAAFIVFVVAGQGLILAGWMLGWHWPRNLAFRLTHAGAIALVVLESWFGVVCPLTWLEFRLRAAAGSPLAADSFVGYWLQRLIFHDAPSWAFTAAYTSFAALVAATLVFYPPNRRRAGDRPGRPPRDAPPPPGTPGRSGPATSEPLDND